MVLQPRFCSKPELLSIVVPAYNEEQTLGALEARVRSVCEDLDQPYELVLVNDGSRDHSLSVMLALREANRDITIVNLSRNFGKEIALTAGLDHAKGDAVVVLDADLQDPPELIGEMRTLWGEGYDVVYAQREVRHGETWLKRKTADLFYLLMERIGPVKMPRDAGDFRMMSRKVVDALGGLREHHRMMKGIFAWVGYPSICIRYRRDARIAGKTKWNYWKLWNFSLEGITSFTTIPLRVTTYLGCVVAGLAFLFSLFVVFKTIFFGERVQGYPTLIVVVLFLGGAQLIALGVIGEYLGRVFDETKGRPLYLVESVRPAEPLAQAPARGGAEFVRRSARS